MQPINYATIMIVDDTPANLRLLATALSGKGYHVQVFPGGEMALRATEKQVPDLVLLDIDMPGMNGYQVCDAFKSRSHLRDVPILFISAMQDANAKLEAFKHGGLDYVTKPFNLEEVFARVATHLELHRLSKELEAHNRNLFRTVAEQVREISEAQLATIFAMAKLAEWRDDDTGSHIWRVSTISQMIARKLRQSDVYEDQIDEQFIENLYRTAPLHDIGKVGIPDAILLKPGKLTPQEFDRIKTHSAIGADTLKAVQDRYPKNDLIRMGVQITRHHHERWDGAGYPDGLGGLAIPLSARIVSLADVYDALRAMRPYKAPFTHAKALEIILAGKGSQFDPHIVDVFISLGAEIAARYDKMR